MPITFEVEDDRIVTTVDDKPKSTKRLARLDNIAFQSKVAVLADEYADDWERLWWVRADGTARVIAAGPELESAIDLLAAKYVQYRQMRPVGPAIVIDVERWVVWEASSGKGE